MNTAILWYPPVNTCHRIKLSQWLMEEIFTSTRCGIHQVKWGEYQPVSVRMSWYSPPLVVVTDIVHLINSQWDCRIEATTEYKRWLEITESSSRVLNLTIGSSNWTGWLTIQCLNTIDWLSICVFCIWLVLFVCELNTREWTNKLWHFTWLNKLLKNITDQYLIHSY